MSVDGVKDVRVVYREGRARVSFDGSRTSPEAMARVLASQTIFTAVPTQSKS